MDRLLTIHILCENERRLLEDQVGRLRELVRRGDGFVLSFMPCPAWLDRLQTGKACLAQASVVLEVVENLAALHGCTGWDAKSLGVLNVCSMPWWHTFSVIGQFGLRV